jgi:hypothetical protein
LEYLESEPVLLARFGAATGMLRALGFIRPISSSKRSVEQVTKLTWNDTPAVD